MKARVMFWAGIPPHSIPLRDVLYFNEYSEEIFEEMKDLFETAVASGVAEVVDNIDLS